MKKDQQKKIVKIIRNEMVSEERKNVLQITKLVLLLGSQFFYLYSKYSKFLGSSIYQIWKEIETNSKSLCML